MIALGGVIGAGLFVGTGAGIALAGPAVLISFGLAGTLALLVMRMLGEMTAEHPSGGAFSVHAEKAIGPWAGFTVGWTYWCTVGVVLAVEATGAAKIAAGWLPGVPQWAWVLLFMAVLTAVNLANVRNFGEFEFWFAGLKIAAIVLFLLLGAAAVLGVLPGVASPGLTHLRDFLPHGWGGVVAGFMAVVFAFGGLEVVTIAAADAENPAQAVKNAVRTSMTRLLVFYLGSLAVVVTLLPWNDSEVGASPYVAVLNRLGIPAAGQIMNVVIFVALLSAINATLYGAARMLSSLAERGEAPKSLLRKNNGVPRNAVLASTAFGFFSVLLNYLWPETVFLLLLNAVGSALLVVWAFIAVSQIRLRRTTPAPAVPMWGFPYLSWLALAAIAAIVVLMLSDEQARAQIVSTGVLVAVIAALGLARSALRRRRVPERP
ncbi:amino acid/polyamine/organocation transporter, APC superfamily [Lentzea xinjiangensis]|uniref:Amino acid/polyamine/organocation transporter, APC superfamily n=1 Tax=Lentzea xinjiangensis TaxID=402600 RepID=A0A1H9QWZ9_9PSEU|nr:amino acid permease [Lentzea xinjiangensis]SER64233.1 amino acid/polyamine/organocation transporter, APC superfamily [Lentzea xinjiangensis]